MDMGITLNFIGILNEMNMMYYTHIEKTNKYL